MNSEHLFKEFKIKYSFPTPHNITIIYKDDILNKRAPFRNTKNLTLKYILHISFLSHGSNDVAIFLQHLARLIIIWEIADRSTSKPVF